ncbi:MAG: TRAP transporter substrate-binding protein [Pseudomonadota bacterium]
MRKRLIFIALFVFFGAALVLCMGAQAQAAPIEIKFATQNPTTAWIHPQGYVPWAKKMEEATKGRIKVTIYPAQTLGKGPEFYDLVRKGIADMSFAMPAYTPGVFPLTEALSLPFMGFSSAAMAGWVQWQLYQKFPQYRAEYSQIVCLSVPSTGPYFIATVKKPIRTLEDVKGMKLRSPGGRPSEALKSAGAVPVMLPIPELYLALEKGVLDGSPIPWEGMLGYMPLKSIKYVNLDWGLWSIPFFVIMNKNTWNRIPKEDQDAIMKVWGAYGSEYFSKAVWDDSAAPSYELIKKHGIEVIKAPPEEVEKWAKQAEPITKKYIADLEAKGLPGQAFYDEARRLIREYKK